MSDLAIRVENLSKRYRIGLKEEKADTFVGAIGSTLKAPWRNFQRLRKLNTFSDGSEQQGASSEQEGNSKPPLRRHSPLATRHSSPDSSKDRDHAEDTIWALNDVSFEVKQGEVLGIIGRNGAGKSTLLKILSRITEPTSGRVELHGRVASLLEVGTGFHPELTGRENIFLNGTILGMSKREIDRKFDEIVDFAGIEKFIDTPVKRYSSGMYVRLAFAVAAHLEPEILLVDEVLAVGDAEFQKKCLGKMQDVAKGGRTVLFVSHNMSAVGSLCSNALLIDGGSTVLLGVTREVISHYVGLSDTRNILHWQGSAGNHDLTLHETWVRPIVGTRFDTGNSLEVGVRLELHRQLNGLIVGFTLLSSDRSPLAYLCYDDCLPAPPQPVAPGLFETRFEIPANTLSAGRYTIEFDIGIHRRARIIRDDGALHFDVQNLSGIARRYPGTNGSHSASLLRPDWSLAHFNSSIPAVRSPVEGR